MNLALASDVEKVDRDRACHGAWGQKLTLPQWLERERRLRAHPWSQSEMQTWLLRDGAGPTLASCETFRMDSRQTVGTLERRGNTYGVASVFTEEQLRGRGYADQMMKLLLAKLRAQDSSALASILFSDVGAPLYARSGYVAVPSFDWVFPPADGAASLDVDALISEAEVAAALAMTTPRTDPFVVALTPLQIDWHLERERIYAQALGMTRPPSCGARIGESIILWARNLKEDELQVLVLRAKTSKDSQRLLLAARRTAALLGRASVRHWETAADRTSELDSSGARLARNGGLSMICPLVQDLGADDWKMIDRALWI